MKLKVFRSALGALRHEPGPLGPVSLFSCYPTKEIYPFLVKLLLGNFYPFPVKPLLGKKHG
jgi:hypothetical protein